MILVVGFPRSGTTFLRRLLAHYVDGPTNPVWDGTTPHHTVAKIHWDYQLADYDDPKIIHIVRDPRDTAISGYFYYLQHFGNRHNHNISNYSLMEFLRGPFSHGFDGRAGWPCGWKEHVERWINRDIVCTSYERLMKDRRVELTWILYWLGFQTTRDDINFAVQRSYEYGQHRVPYVYKPNWERADKTAHPTVGEWRDHFGRRESEFMVQYCNNLMYALGYTER